MEVKVPTELVKEYWFTGAGTLAATFSWELPLKQVGFGVAVTELMVGGWFTVTVTFAVPVQPPTPVAVTVYVVVLAAVQVTMSPVVALRPVAGAHA